MLQIRNTPDKGCKLSPAQIIFGKPLRYAFSFINHVCKFDNQAISTPWRDAWRLKEMALKDYLFIYINPQKFRQKKFWRKNFGGKNF